MREYIRKHIYLILGVLCIIFFVSLNFLPKVPKSEQINTKEFNHLLTDKEWLVDTYLDSMLFNVNNRRFSEWIERNGNSLDNLFRQQGFVFYLFFNQELVFWSNNAIPLPTDSLWIETPFYKFGNAFAAVRKKESGTYKAIGLIQIKSDFPFENEFLKNGFHPSFTLDCQAKLTFNEADNSNSIYNKEQKYLFSLTPAPQCKNIRYELLMAISLMFALFFLVIYLRIRLKGKVFGFVPFLGLTVSLILFRGLLQYFRLPSFLDQLPLFRPEYFAFSHLFPSLGDLLLSTTLLTGLLFIFYTKVSLPKLSNYKKGASYGLILIWLLVIMLYAHFEHYLFKHLVSDSNFEYEAFDVLSLNYFSFVGYYILLVVFIGWILLIDKAFHQFKQVMTPQKATLWLVVLFAVTLVILIITNNMRQFVSWGFLFSILFFWMQIRFRKTPRLGAVVLLIALFAAYATYFIRQQNFMKRIEESRVLAVNLAREQDPVAEIVLTETMEQLKTDTIVKRMLQTDWFEFQNLVEYLQRNYFTGYLGRYNFQLTLCNRSDSVLLDATTQEWAPCFSFFKTLIENNGTATGIDGLYYLRNLTGGINYFVKVKIPLKQGWEEVTLFLELTSKPNYEVLGYPELLLEKPLVLYENYHNLSYAKYSGNQLLNRTGHFPYAFDRSVYQFRETEFAFFESEQYDHLLYNADQGNTVIVSFPTVRFYNVFISFTYIFLFLLIITLLLMLFANRITRLVTPQFTIKNKIIFSIISVLTISLIFVGGGTVFYTFRQFDRGQNEILNEKLQSVLVEIETKLSNLESIHQSTPEYLNSLLVKFSNVFFTDINLYDLNGNLVATSRKEIFDNNLTSTKMNASAYRELVMNKKARLVQREHIGDLGFYSAYVPFIGADRKLLAYINLPYFTKEVAFKQELMRVAVALINIYTLLIFLGIAIAVYLSSRITEPLRLISLRMSAIDLSKENEIIAYEGNDEIAQLVFEYNRMLGELSKSVQLLAKSERESAWREMARQIAHEIKNPLTPMKLSIQLLEKSWENNDADFEDRFHRFSHTLIEQIDSLSSIATAFSQFAQMPKARAEKVNLVERIYQSAELFKECSYVQFNFSFPQEIPVYVKADNERILQVFNNLIKNAIQAIPKEKQGEVSLTISQTETHIVVQIKDNGTGISPDLEPKMFQPNFTTKSSGTGLGLAIVKNIVEEVGGAIWYETVLQKGTSFFVSFPVFTNNKFGDL